MRMLRVELSRFFSRRAVALLLIAAALLTALIAGTTIWNTRPVSAGDRTAAQAQVDEQVRQPEFQQEIERCRENPEDYFGPDSGVDDCERALTPRAEWYLGRAELSLDQERGNSGIGVIVLVTALMIIVGTTYAGADWASGSMSNQLLFEPRRLRVWAGKAMAATVGCLLVSAVIVAGYWLALYLVADSRGIATGSGVQEQIRWMAARGVALAGLAGLGVYALTMLLRHTVATLAVLFAYAAGGEALLAALPVDRSARWSPASNVFAWIRDGIKVYDETIVCPPGRGACEQTFTLTLVQGATYLGVLLVLTLLVSSLMFRRRDIP